MPDNQEKREWRKDLIQWKDEIVKIVQNYEKAVGNVDNNLDNLISKLDELGDKLKMNFWEKPLTKHVITIILILFGFIVLIVVANKFSVPIDVTAGEYGFRTCPVIQEQQKDALNMSAS